MSPAARLPQGARDFLVKAGVAVEDIDRVVELPDDPDAAAVAKRKAEMLDAKKAADGVVATAPSAAPAARLETPRRDARALQRCPACNSKLNYFSGLCPKRCTAVPVTTADVTPVKPRRVEPQPRMTDMAAMRTPKEDTPSPPPAMTLTVGGTLPKLCGGCGNTLNPNGRCYVCRPGGIRKDGHPKKPGGRAKAKALREAAATAAALTGHQGAVPPRLTPQTAAEDVLTAIEVLGRLTPVQVDRVLAIIRYDRTNAQ